MPISAIEIAGIEVCLWELYRAWAKKKATEVAYRLPTSASYLR